MASHSHAAVDVGYVIFTFIMKTISIIVNHHHYHHHHHHYHHYHHHHHHHHHHYHRTFRDEHNHLGDPSIRDAVFAVNDGLTSNCCIVFGVVALTLVDPTKVFLCGLVGMLSGAFNSASGNWMAQIIQTEAESLELRREEEHLMKYPREEERHFTELLENEGFSQETIRAIFRDIEKSPSMQLKLHAQIELGIDPEIPADDPTIASISSFMWFFVGAFIPLFPWVPFFGLSPTYAVMATVFLSLSSLSVIGVLVRRFTETTLERHILVGSLSMTFAYLTGLLVRVWIS